MEKILKDKRYTICLKCHSCFLLYKTLPFYPHFKKDFFCILSSDPLIFYRLTNFSKIKHKFVSKR